MVTMLETKDCFIWNHSFDNNSFIRWNRWRLDEKEKKNWDYMSSSSSVFLDIARWVFSLRINRQLGKGKGLCKIDFAQNKCILSCTQIFRIKRIKTFLRFVFNYQTAQYEDLLLKESKPSSDLCLITRLPSMKISS